MRLLGWWQVLLWVLGPPARSLEDEHTEYFLWKVLVAAPPTPGCFGPPPFGFPATEAIVKKPVAGREPSEKNWKGVKELT
ncbi:hypothetical protein HPG69_017050 [Diceros bicornis minor]|uniref:Uncharacterized protein n=1 Tax=Diceros bicornis minor TaxID=77932 RepID=A0A7J7ECC2_DICBM|nr:hypothetical protein HPG69_017050 [Diceros bicornis minor]